MTQKTSRSPFRDIFSYSIDEEAEKKRIEAFVSPDRQTVAIQGLGFVGSAMAAALAGARGEGGRILYNVIGVDLPDEQSYWKIAMTNEGRPPIVSTDEAIDTAFSTAADEGNLTATWSEAAYAAADVVIIDINLDINKKELGDPFNYDFTYEGYLKAVDVIARNIGQDTLVMVESTVPPGMTAKILYPRFREIFESRGLDPGRVLLAHSYERVMPGKDYLASITDFFRVFSGIDPESRRRARAFLESFINTNDYPLSELHSTTASEMAKVLENSFRAMNIAFLQEWTEYAEKAGVNLFEVIRAIRVRPTHRNIMAPGFGVGGYCLTKDSLLADWSWNNLFGGGDHLEMSLKAVAVNDLMPKHTFERLKRRIPDLEGKNVTILGISYLNDVADTRYSPADYFYDLCAAEKAVVTLHDPIVRFWEEKGLPVETDLGALSTMHHDAAVLAVRHSQYMDMTPSELSDSLPGVKVIIDANDILSDEKAGALREMGIEVLGVGKGHWTAGEGQDE